MSKATARGAKRRPAARTHPVRPTVALIPLAVWLAVVPYVAPALGFGLDLPAMLEVVDHVVPAVAMIASAGIALRLRGRPSAVYAFAVAGGLCLLAGLWTFATHVPLLGQARQGIVSWGAAIWHSAPGPVIMAVALAALVPALRNVD